MTDFSAPVTAQRKSGFGTWFLWALGVRTPQSDSEYGEKLVKYRKWSSKPVTIASILVFVLIAVKLVLVFNAFFTAFNNLDAERIVLQHGLSTPVVTIVIGVFAEILGAVLHAVPWFVTAPLIILWLAAFVIDFIVAATLAENKKLWWKRHWGGIITALITIP